MRTLRCSAVAGILATVAVTLVGPTSPALAAEITNPLTITDRSITPIDTGNGFARVPNSPDVNALWAGNSFKFGPDSSGTVYRQASGTLDPITSPCAGAGSTVQLTATADTELFQNAGEWFSARFGIVNTTNGNTMQTGATLYPGTYNLGTTGQFPPIGARVFSVSATVPFADLQAGRIGLNMIMETHQTAGKYWIVDNLAVNYTYTCPPTTSDDSPATDGSGITFNPLANDTPVGTSTFDVSTLRLIDGNGNPATTVTNSDGTYVVDTSTGEVTFTPVAGYTGPAAPIQYSVSDSDGDSAVATITVAAIVEVPVIDPAVGGAAAVLLLGGLGVYVVRRRRSPAAA